MKRLYLFGGILVGIVAGMAFVYSCGGGGGSAVIAATPGPRTISVPPAALSINPSGTIITPGNNGLQWQSDFVNGARLVVRKPADYAGDNVTFRIFFYPTTGTTANVAFFIRPGSFNAGDLLTDVPSVTSTPPTVGTLGTLRLLEQSFTIDSSKLVKDWWSVFIQRTGGAPETYVDDVVVIGVALQYNAE